MTSILHPLDQGIILVMKRLYRERFLEKVMVVLEDETDESEDTRTTYITKSKELHPKIRNFQLCSSFKSSKEPNIQT
jgi:hypothetical protein